MNVWGLFLVSISLVVLCLWLYASATVGYELSREEDKKTRR